MHSHICILQKERGKVDKDGVTMGLTYCFEYEQMNALREILLTILKERPITLIPTIFACFFVFFLKKLSDLIIKISKHTYNSIYHIYILTTSFFQ